MRDVLLKITGVIVNGTAKAEVFEGNVDRLEDGWVLGWAWTPGNPTERITVDVLVDGVRVTGGKAEIYRADLERCGKGDGRYGFEIRIPHDIKDGEPHEVHIFYGETTRDLQGSPLLVTPDHGDQTQIGGSRGMRYRSRFGGFWTDLTYAHTLVEGKRALRWISEAEAALLDTWINEGFTIIPQAVRHHLIDEVDQTVERIWNGTSQDQYYVEFWERDHKTIQPAGPKFRDKQVKVLDLYAHSGAARQIVFAPPIVRFLTLVFERPLLAFQSLYFRWGSTQDIHQDSAFVKVSSPMELTASWIALEDVRPNSGELEYYVGSHELEDYLFEGAFKWMPFRSPEYHTFITSLRTRSEARGLKLQRFLPKKGDVLIWSADLAHGGSKDVMTGVTRKSLVTHYCPANCDPVYAQPGLKYPRHRFDDVASYTFAPR
jgi:phytanoyl-CoA dioxygenase PhyH